MGKVSIGLRGWRFEESAVFAEDGSFRPMAEMPAETRSRLSRLTALVNRPCDACWLVHGDEEIERCNPARVVYGEPMAEVVLCNDHESDFVYWFREEGGSTYRGTDDLEDAFHEWFADGGRAPDEYAGLEHVDTAAEDLPDPEAALDAATDGAASDEGDEHASSPGEATEPAVEAAEGTADSDEISDDDTDAAADPEFSDLDLSREYPGSK